jgi:hypothetical protein
MLWPCRQTIPRTAWLLPPYPTRGVEQRAFMTAAELASEQRAWRASERGVSLLDQCRVAARFRFIALPDRGEP